MSCFTARGPAIQVYLFWFKRSSSHLYESLLHFFFSPPPPPLYAVCTALVYSSCSVKFLLTHSFSTPFSEGCMEKMFCAVFFFFCALALILVVFLFEVIFWFSGDSVSSETNCMLHSFGVSGFESAGPQRRVGRSHILRRRALLYVLSVVIAS